ncbi:MAG: vWA domain-containing protein [bacterium]
MTMNPLLPMEQLVLLLTAILAGGMILAWRASARLSHWRRWAALAARCFALAALATIALNFGHWRKPGADVKPRWCVMLDRSASMATADMDGQSRWEAARRLALRLEKEAGTRRDLDVFAFSANVDGTRQTADSVAGLVPDGQVTDAGRALETVTGAGMPGGDRPIGIILLTDGRQTIPDADPMTAGMRARAQDAPVFAVPFGKVKDVRDIAVKAARRLVIGFVGQPVRIQGEVVTRWSDEVSVAVRLLDGTGRAVATNEVRLPAVGRGTVSFTVTPERPGYASYRLQVAPWEGENDVRNNESAFEINALDRKIRLLLVEGVPYWDSKFLGQHLRKQPNMEVTAVYRTAPERFFKTDPAGVPQAESKAIFPDTAAELGSYDIVVFGKGAEYFLTPERISALKSFVADQGGSVVFARGRPYADQGGGLEDLEPVEWGGTSSMDCRLTPRGEGEDIGLFAGLLPGRDDAVWSRLPLVRCSQTSVGLKSFAQVLAEGRRTGDASLQAVPLLVSRRFGKGMTVVMNVDGFWQWSFFPSAQAAAGMYQELWSQLMLWVGTYSEFLPGHDYALHLGVTTAPPNMPVRVQVRRRGLAATTREAPRLRVTCGLDTVQEITLAEGDRVDSWEAVLTLADPGLYRVALVSKDVEARGRELGALLQIQAPPGESDDVNPDPEFLAKLAAASGGNVLEAGALAEAMDQRERVRSRQADQGGNAVWEPLWDRGWLLAVILAGLAVEWIIRRRNGLA